MTAIMSSFDCFRAPTTASPVEIPSRERFIFRSRKGSTPSLLRLRISFPWRFAPQPPRPPEARLWFICHALVFIKARWLRWMRVIQERSTLGGTVRLRLPFSCSGNLRSAPGMNGAGRSAAVYLANCSGPVVPGSAGGFALACRNRKAEVKSPKVCLRQSLMFGSLTPVNFSRN